MGWIARKLGLCEHDWKAVSARGIKDPNAGHPNLFFKTVVTSVCQKCRKTGTRTLIGSVELKDLIDS